MADGTSRAGNALQKRQESLKRWKGSETDRQPVDRSKKKAKIKFDAGIVFLSAVSSGDVDEVKKLLAKGTDINFQNVDGLTALHQACIDETFDLVKILITNGARLDIRDNEGWTPLHAAASCGSVEIAKYLLEKGADVAAVNNEGELPLDLAEEEDMEDILTDEIERLGIDAEEARNVEEKLMLEDAQSWLNKNSINDLPDRTGATALHVAASKGYLKVMALLLQLNVDPNVNDNDGWSPLHAAAHWGQTEACEVLADNGADFTARNKVGQTPTDLAEPDMVKILEELKKRQNDKSKIKENAPRIKTNLDSNAPPPLKRRSSITRIKDQNLFLRDINQERITLDARRDSSSTKLHYIKEPNFPDSPKEDKEKEKLFEDGKDESETESVTGSETSSEEESSEQEIAPGIGKNPSMNSIPHKPAGSKQPVKSESSGCDSETESEEEQKPPTTRTFDRLNQISTTTNSRTTPNRPYNLTSRRAPSSESKGLKSPFLDKDKDKKTTPASSASKTETSKIASRFENHDKKLETTTSPRVGSFPVRTTASTTSTSTTSTTSGSSRDRTSSAKLTDKDDTTTSTRRRPQKITKRAPTTFIGKGRDDEDEEDDKSKDNDVASKDTSKDTKKDSIGTTSDYISRNRPIVTNADKSDDSVTSKRFKGTEQNKENEEGEMSTWRRQRLERERQRERREQEEKEKEREKEREKEKEKESETPSHRRRRDRERERDQKSGDDSQDSKDVKKNAKTNEELEHKTSSSRRRRIYDRDSDDSKSTDRMRSTRPTAVADSRVPTSTARDNTTAESRARLSTARDNTTAGSRVPLSTARANTSIQITETDPKKLRDQLQEAHIELQQYKVKLETTTQEKEKLEQKLTQLTEDLKQLTDLKAENQRLKDENGALIRVISKLSKPPT